MARIVRMALDVSVASLDFVRPVVSQVWVKGKVAIGRTGARRIVQNAVVATAETKISDLVTFLDSQMRSTRADMLKRELKYLEGEICKCRSRIKESECCGGGKKVAGSVLANVGLSLKDKQENRPEEKKE